MRTRFPLLAAFLLALLPAAQEAFPADLARELGQLLVVNVDGFGYSGPLAVSPAFVDLVSRLQVGGVIPHYGSSSYEKIRKTNRSLSALTSLPLLVCCDIVTLSASRKEPRATTAAHPSPAGGAGAATAAHPSPAGEAGAATAARHTADVRKARFGDGYVGGFIGRFAALPDEAFRTLAELNALVLSAIGVNTALGPTVDNSTRGANTAERAREVTASLRRYGLQPVLKHFPFLPKGSNLHKESPDTAVAEQEVKNRVCIFRELRGEAGILMTTHIFDSLIDKNSIVTFSPTWISLLHRETDFDGLIMSDGLLMLRNYADRSLLKSGRRPPGSLPGDNPASWAERAILAGHDMIIVEGSAATTVAVFNALLGAAESDTAAGRLLRQRIESAYARIVRYKESRKAQLTRRIDIPAVVIDTIITMVSAAGNPAFTFDAATLAGIEPALRGAAVVE